MYSGSSLGHQFLLKYKHHQINKSALNCSSEIKELSDLAEMAGSTEKLKEDSIANPLDFLPCLLSSLIF